MVLSLSMDQEPEISELNLFTEIIQMSKSRAFTDMMKIIDGEVEESHTALVGCMSGSPDVYRTFTIRYQQSLVIQRAIKSWLESAQKGLDEIHEQMRKDLERAESESSPFAWDNV